MKQILHSVELERRYIRISDMCETLTDGRCRRYTMATVKHVLLVSLLSLDIPTSSMRWTCLSSEGGSVEAQIVSLHHQNEAQIAFLAISCRSEHVSRAVGGQSGEGCVGRTCTSSNLT
jgi:hypothetical protein